MKSRSIGSDSHYVTRWHGFRSRETAIRFRIGDFELRIFGQRTGLTRKAGTGETAHKLARIFYTVLRYGVAYQKRSEEEFVVDHQKRMEKALHRRAKELGYELRKVERPAEAEPQPA